MKCTSLLSILMTCAVTGAQESDGHPGVALVLPPALTKYAAKMPTHVPAIRADSDGKLTAAQTITGKATLPDARTAGKSRFFFQIAGTTAAPSRNSPSAIVLRTPYKLFYRGAKGYEELAKGDFMTSGFASPFQDPLIEHYGKLGAGLTADVSRALTSKVLEEKEIKVPPPPARNQGPFAEPESPRERLAYKVERKAAGDEVFFTFRIYNRLPVSVRIREMEIVNTVTGECHSCTPNANGDPWIFESGKRIEVGAKMPANQAPLEAQAVRIRELFLILPD